VLYAFLNGTDLTTQFLLKALVVLFVAAIGFMHFIADLWGYWKLFPSRNRSVGIATLVLVFLSVIAGFFIVGTPAQARLARFDAQKINDLQGIQSQIVNYWQSKHKLPILLSDLQDPLIGFVPPSDPQTTTPYEYKSTDPLSFELCATFNSNGSALGGGSMPMPARPYGLSSTDQNWQHPAGHVCFTRTIDPQLIAPKPAP
jgi:hypothetical protein